MTKEAKKLYCFKCKKKQDSSGLIQSKMKNGRPCITGPCKVCGTKMFQIGTLVKE